MASIWLPDSAAASAKVLANVIPISSAFKPKLAALDIKFLPFSKPPSNPLNLLAPPSAFKAAPGANIDNINPNPSAPSVA